MRMQNWNKNDSVPPIVFTIRWGKNVAKFTDEHEAGKFFRAIRAEGHKPTATMTRTEVSITGWR